MNAEVATRHRRVQVHLDIVAQAEAERDGQCVAVDVDCGRVFVVAEA